MRIARHGRRPAAARPAAALAALALATGCGDRGVSTAAFELVPFEDGGPLGVAHLEQDGEALRGWVAVWGLVPGSRHAAHLGPTGRECAARPPDPRVRLPLVVADENGVGFRRFAVDAPEGVVDRAWALTVHVDPGPRSARAACGAVVPGERLSEAALTGAGPSSAASAGVAGLVQLRDGRPVGGVRTLRARVGERVAVAVRSNRADELAFRGLGLTIQVGPGAIARFSVRPRAPGTAVLAGPSTGGRPVLRLDVRPRRAGP